MALSLPYLAKCDQIHPALYFGNDTIPQYVERQRVKFHRHVTPAGDKGSTACVGRLVKIRGQLVSFHVLKGQCAFDDLGIRAKDASRSRSERTMSSPLGSKSP
jgi:hypothetical protein